MSDLPEYTYRWTERNAHTGDDNGPYEVRGNAAAIYRACIMIGHGRDHVNGEVLSPNGTVAQREEFYADITRALGIEWPHRGI